MLAVAGVASAATIVQPSTNPFSVPADGAGNPAPFTVQATGYSPGATVFVEICDGLASTTPGWDPTLNCDLGTSPAAAIADQTGKATFDAADPNFRVGVFRGPSPQGLFNCLAPGQADPNNGLPSFTNCQLRVSTNNTASTSDQAFITLTLPAPGTGTTTTSTLPPTTTTVPPTTTTTVPGPKPLSCWTNPTSVPLGGRTQLRARGFVAGTLVSYALAPNNRLLGRHIANAKGAIDPYVTAPSWLTPGHYLIRVEGVAAQTGAKAKCWATFDVQMSSSRPVAYVGGPASGPSSSSATGRMLLGLALVPAGFGMAIAFPRRLRTRKP